MASAVTPSAEARSQSPVAHDSTPSRAQRTLFKSGGAAGKTWYYTGSCDRDAAPGSSLTPLPPLRGITTPLRGTTTSLRGLTTPLRDGGGSSDMLCQLCSPDDHNIMGLLASPFEPASGGRSDLGSPFDFRMFASPEQQLGSSEGRGGGRSRLTGGGEESPTKYRLPPPFRLPVARSLLPQLGVHVDDFLTGDDPGPAATAGHNALSATERQDLTALQELASWGANPKPEPQPQVSLAQAESLPGLPPPDSCTPRGSLSHSCDTGTPTDLGKSHHEASAKPLENTAVKHEAFGVNQHAANDQGTSSKQGMSAPLETDGCGQHTCPRAQQRHLQQQRRQPEHHVRGQEQHQRQEQAQGDQRGSPRQQGAGYAPQYALVHPSLFARLGAGPHTLEQLTGTAAQHGLPKATVVLLERGVLQNRFSPPSAAAGVGPGAGAGTLKASPTRPSGAAQAAHQRLARLLNGL